MLVLVFSRVMKILIFIYICNILCAPRNPTSPSRNITKMLEHRANIGRKINSPNLKILVNMGTKNLQNRAQNPPNRAQMAPRGGQEGENFFFDKNKQTRRRVKEPHGPVSLADVLPKKMANKAPTWLPKWSQDGHKIDSQIDHVSWNRSLI